MAALRIIFMGTAELSCASLGSLACDERFSVAAVVTQPDKPKGRDLKLQPSPVKSLALKLNLPVLQPERARDEQFIAGLRALQPDLIVVVAYGQILPQTILDLPIQWAIATGENETGVTVMKMDAGLDTGPVVSQRRTPISPEDDSSTLHDRLAQLGAELLAHTIPDYVARKIQPQPQDAGGASHAPKIKKENGRIDWNLPAKTIWNRLRAFTPWPGAFTILAGEPGPSRPAGLKIWKAEIIERGGDGLPGRPTAKLPCPGEILSADKSGIVVGCGENALRILELQREGGRRMNAAEFLAGHALKPGEKFALPAGTTG